MQGTPVGLVGIGTPGSGSPAKPREEQTPGQVTPSKVRASPQTLLKGERTRASGCVGSGREEEKRSIRVPSKCRMRKASRRPLRQRGGGRPEPSLTDREAGGGQDRQTDRQTEDSARLVLIQSMCQESLPLRGAGCALDPHPFKVAHSVRPHHREFNIL